MTKNKEDNMTPQKYYVVIAIFNVLTMITSNMALQFIPYVVLVVGKGKRPFKNEEYEILTFSFIQHVNPFL